MLFSGPYKHHPDIVGGNNRLLLNIKLYQADLWRLYMHDIPWYIALLISFPQTLLIIEFGFRLFNIQLKTKYVLLLGLIIAGLCYLIRPFAIPYALNTLMLIALLSLLSCLVCHIRFKYCFISVTLGVIICGVLESLLLPLIMKVMQVSMEEVVVNPWIDLMAFAPIFIITAILLLYTVKQKFILYDFSNEENKKHNTLGAVAAILIQTLFLMLINTSVIAGVEFSALKKAIPYLNLGLVIMCIVTLFIIKNIENQAKYQTKALLLKNHLNQVESILKSTEIQRHEYARHMQTIQALIELNKIEAAKKYINGITSQYWSNNILFHTDQPAISALLNSKNSVARINNIDFAVAVKCDLSNVAIPVWDLCSILGNLLDNALEAAAKDPEPRVGIEFKHENGSYAIYIINNGSRISESSRIFEAGYTTKGSEGRGYGLYIVKKLLNKYQGKIEIINKPKTTIILRIPGAGDCYDKNDSLEYG
mgnify:FL=1